MHTFLIMKKKLGSELIPTSHLIRVLGGAASHYGHGREELQRALDRLLRTCWAPEPSPTSGIYRERPKRNSVMLFLIIHLFGNELLDFSVQSSLATCSEQKREQWTWAFRVVRREMVCKSPWPLHQQAQERYLQLMLEQFASPISEFHTGKSNVPPICSSALFYQLFNWSHSPWYLRNLSVG